MRHWRSALSGVLTIMENHLLNSSQSETNRDTQRKSSLHALDVSILFSSSFFWGWYQLAILSPVFFTPFSNMDYFALYRMFALLATVASLFFWYKMQDLALKLLNSRRWEVFFVSLAVLGNGITAFGVYFDALFIVLFGGIIVGFMAAYFMLAWSRMYSRRGSSSTASSITGAFFLGTVIAMLVSTMAPIAAAITTAILPCLVMLSLIGVQALFYSKDNPDSDVAHALQESADVAFGANEIMVKSRGKSNSNIPSNKDHHQQTPAFSKTPFALALAFIIFGFAFGYDVSSIVYGPTNMIIMISGAISAIVLFLISLYKREWLYGAFLVGILAGVASFALIPPIGLGVNGKIYAVILSSVGAVSFFAMAWTLLADMTTITKRGSINVFAQGMLYCYLGVSLGYIFSYAIQNSEGFVSTDQVSLLTILGFVFFIGLLLLFVGNQNMWDNLKARLSNTSEPGFLVQSHPHNQVSDIKDQVKVIVVDYKLTEREGEILELLVTGRSRPRIAQALCVSENTVNTHVQHIYRKMNVKSIQELLDFVL